MARVLVQHSALGPPPHPLALPPGPGPWLAGPAVVAAAEVGGQASWVSLVFRVQGRPQHSSGETWSCRASAKLWIS